MSISFKSLLAYYTRVIMIDIAKMGASPSEKEEEENKRRVSGTKIWANFEYFGANRELILG